MGCVIHTVFFEGILELYIDLSSNYSLKVHLSILKTPRLFRLYLVRLGVPPKSEELSWAIVGTIRELNLCSESMQIDRMDAAKVWLRRATIRNGDDALLVNFGRS
jgi:hypothetical protein